jgi:hypothetical protein
MDIYNIYVRQHGHHPSHEFTFWLCNLESLVNRFNSTLRKDSIQNHILRLHISNTCNLLLSIIRKNKKVVKYAYGYYQFEIDDICS